MQSRREFGESGTRGARRSSGLFEVDPDLMAAVDRTVGGREFPAARSFADVPVGFGERPSVRPRGPHGRKDDGIPLVAVVGGCGGAGASTLAVCLAVTALELGCATALFDADPLGGGLDSLADVATTATPPTRRAGGRNEGNGRDGAYGEWPHDSDPQRWPHPGRRRPGGELSLVSWTIRDGETIPVTGMRNALRDLRRETDLVVIDLPRAIDDSAQLALSEATHSLVIAPVSERAAVAASRLLPKLTAVGPRPELVARLPGRDDMTPREFADLLGLPLAGVVRPPRGRGYAPADPLNRLAGRSAVSLRRFSRRFIERCSWGRPGAADRSGVAA
jgi:secretion/DNA translocation related CpaE-like protein